MKKWMIILAAAAAAWYGWQQVHPPIKDPDFKRIVEHVKEHSGKDAVSGMARESETGEPFKPSDWLSRFLSTTYSAANTPMEPFNIIWLPWSFRENAALKEVYAPDARFLIIIPDNTYNEIIVRGFQGWEGEQLFEKRWGFPEIPGRTASAVKKRPFLSALFKPAPPEDARYEIESGLVIYEVEIGASGDLLDFRMTGKGELHFEDWGKREALYMQTLTDTMGLRDRANSKLLTVGGTTYTIDYLQKTGTKISGESKQAADYSDQALEAQGGVRKATREIAGRTCQVWQVEGDEICVWKQIPLIQETVVFGKRAEMRAVEIHENEIPAPHHFQVPENIRF